MQNENPSTCSLQTSRKGNRPRSTGAKGQRVLGLVLVGNRLGQPGPGEEVMPKGQNRFPRSGSNGCYNIGGVGLLGFWHTCFEVPGLTDPLPGPDCLHTWREMRGNKRAGREPLFEEHFECTLRGPKARCKEAAKKGKQLPGDYLKFLRMLALQLHRVAANGC